MTASAIRGYHPDFVFQCTTALASIQTGVAGTITAAAVATFAGTREVNADLFIQTMRLRQVVDGAAGTTQVEVFRTRSGTPTSLGTISIASGGGTFVSASTVPASAALRNLQPGDFVSVQANT